MQLLLADLHPPEPSRRSPSSTMRVRTVLNSLWQRALFPSVSYFTRMWPPFLSPVWIHVRGTHKNTAEVDFDCLASLPQPPRSKRTTDGIFWFPPVRLRLCARVARYHRKHFCVLQLQVSSTAELILTGAPAGSECELECKLESVVMVAGAGISSERREISVVHSLQQLLHDTTANANPT